MEQAAGTTPSGGETPMGTSKPSSGTPAEDPGRAGRIADGRQPPPIRGGPSDRTVAFDGASPLLSIAFGDDAGFVDESASRFSLLMVSRFS
jgi:hypothetical protein